MLKQLPKKLSFRPSGQVSKPAAITGGLFIAATESYLVYRSCAALSNTRDVNGDAVDTSLLLNNGEA